MQSPPQSHYLAVKWKQSLNGTTSLKTCCDYKELGHWRWDCPCHRKQTTVKFLDADFHPPETHFHVLLYPLENVQHLTAISRDWPDTTKLLMAEVVRDKTTVQYMFCDAADIFPGSPVTKGRHTARPLTAPNHFRHPLPPYNTLELKPRNPMQYV